MAQPRVPAPPQLEEGTSQLAGFKWDEVPPRLTVAVAPTPPPSLGPLAAFAGDWRGVGLNTIFRPDSPTTPTPLPTPETGDNVLEINLTSESLSFSKELGRVPNRGMVQADAFLNGVHYLQSIEDVTVEPHTGVHLEPGLWMIVEPTEDPSVPQSVVRMASIPHGTTICAQGLVEPPAAGAPTIAPVDITPFAAGSPASTSRFASQEAANSAAARIPQDLSSFVAAGTITQDILNDPNTVLRNATAGLSIIQATEIHVATNAAPPLFGGGTDNIAFLLGSSAAISSPDGPGQNAQAIQMSATFWIEQVEFTVEIPADTAAHDPVILIPTNLAAGQLAPSFELRPASPISASRSITVQTTMIQYSQLVELNFNGLTWPHVTVSTLVPAEPVPIPPSVLA